MQIMSLKNIESSEPINLNKETEGSCSNRSENSSDINLDLSRTRAIESSLSSHPNRTLFPLLKPTAVAQLFQPSTRPDLQCPKLEQPIQDESFCNMMFCGVEDQSGFWPWPEHQNYQETNPNLHFSIIKFWDLSEPHSIRL